MRPLRILIIVFKGIGDVLLTTPLIRALKKHYPECEISFLTKRASEKILKFNPNITEILVRENGVQSRIAFKKFDITIDFMLSLTSGYYTLLSKAKKRLAFYRPLGFLFYNILPHHKHKGYTVYDRLQILEPLKIKHDGISLDLNFDAKHERTSLDFLHKHNLNKEKDFIITLDATSPREHRQWPMEKFSELADMLSEKINAKIIFLWGGNELEYVKKALSYTKKKHILSDKFDLLELAALIKKSRLHIGTTSAPMHIATSQNIPTFTIYGQKNGPKNWSPPGKIHGYAQGDLDALKTEDVFKKLEGHIKSL
jgi:ADP-heptose:LPS heptosyltransferase